MDLTRSHYYTGAEINAHMWIDDVPLPPLYSNK